jgi:hypothetical protein
MNGGVIIDHDATRNARFGGTLYIYKLARRLGAAKRI